MMTDVRNIPGYMVGAVWLALLIRWVLHALGVKRFSLTTWPTLAGYGWVMMAAVLSLIGLLRAIGLLLFLAYLMGILFLLNGARAGRGLHRLQARRRFAGPVFAQAPFLLQLEIHNPSRRNQLAVSVEDRGPDHVVSVFLLRLFAGQTVLFGREIVLPRRGVYDFQPLRASCSYPFGLAQGTRIVGAAESIVVFPRLGRLHRGRLRRFLGWSAAALAHARPVAHAQQLQEEFHGLRPFRTGDSPRWIHWRTSARRGELMVREFEQYQSENLILVLEPWLPSDPVSGPKAEDLLEEAISLAATICWEWCRQSGDRLVLAIAGHPAVALEGVTGRELALRLLERLAVQSGDSVCDPAKLGASLAGVRLPAAPVLLVTTRPSPLRDLLRAALRRPVAALDVAELDECDFYERPTAHAT